MADFEGRGQCDHCKTGVDVYSNRSGLAYYNCGPCGFRGQHMRMRTSNLAIAGLDRHADPDGGAPAAPPAVPPAAPPAPAPAARRPPPAPPAPTQDPAAQPTPAAAAKTAQKPKSALGDFLSKCTL